METWTDSYGKRVIVHDKTQDCLDNNCCIHNPSNHALSHANLYWRVETFYDIKPSHMERICEHGVGHPDPDSLAYLRRTGEESLANSLSIHGCDGCCRGINNV